MRNVLPGLLLITISFSAPVMAQEAVPLSLQEALDAALHNNREIKIARLEEESASAQFKQTNAVFLPQISLSYSAFTTNNPLNAFGFKLQQQSITPADFNPELLNNPSATQNFMTKAEWRQPILNMDMMAMRKAAHQQQDIYAYKSKRTQEYLAFEVQKAYAQLQLAHQASVVVDEALQTAGAMYTVTSNRFAKGYLQKSDLLTVQVHVSALETQQADAKSNVMNASDYISLLMGKETGVVYRVDTVQNLAQPKLWDEQVPENRADFLALQSAVKAKDHMLRSGKLSYLPKLNGYAEYLINDKEALGFGSDAYLIGAQLSWNLFNGMQTQSKVAQYRVERDKMTEQLNQQMEQSQLELNKTIRQAADLKFALQQHETAVAQAAEALRIQQNRYQQGLTTTTETLQAQALLSQQQLSRAQVAFQYNITLAYLEFLTTTPSEK